LPQGAVEAGSSGDQPLMWTAEYTHCCALNFLKRAVKLHTWDFNRYMQISRCTGRKQKIPHLPVETSYIFFRGFQ